MQFLRCQELLRSLLTAVVTMTIATTAVAQSSRISRTEIEDLNRRIPSGEIGNIDDLRPRGATSTRRNVDVSGVDRRVLSNLLKEAYDESGRLYTSLDADYRRNPQLRSLLSELTRLRSQTNRLVQSLAANTDLEIIVEDFQQVDSYWRLFSYRMTQARGLSAATKQSLDRIDGLDRRIGQLFKVEPTLDRTALTQQLASLESSLYLLSEELDRDSTLSNLAVSSRKLEQLATRVESLVIEDYPYDRIVSEYTRFDNSWNALLAQLSNSRSSYIERIVQRIVDADYSVHELLWIQNTTSRAQLKQTTESLIRDVDEFYNRTPLKLLLNFQNAEQTLQVAEDFYGTVQNFQNNLENNESDAQLVESYRYIEDQGKLFIRTFRQMKSQAAMQVLQEIEDGITSLNRELNLGGTVSQVDTDELFRIAASMEDLSEQLDLDIRQWLNTERPSYRSEVTAASAAFVKRTQRLHRMLDSEPRLQDLQRETDSLYQEWKALYSYLGRCKTADRANLSYRARLINDDLLDLDSLLQL